MQMLTAASPEYLACYGTPNTPYDLTRHQMLSLRLPTHGGLLTWEFLDPKKQGKVVKVQPHSQLIANGNRVLQLAALHSKGLMWAPRAGLEEELVDGRLVEVLADWAMVYQGYHLYYPNLRADSPLFQALVQCLREAI